MISALSIAAAIGSGFAAVKTGLEASLIFWRRRLACDRRRRSPALRRNPVAHLNRYVSALAYRVCIGTGQRSERCNPEHGQMGRSRMGRMRDRHWANNGPAHIAASSLVAERRDRC